MSKTDGYIKGNEFINTKGITQGEKDKTVRVGKDIKSFNCSFIEGRKQQRDEMFEFIGKYL